MKKLIYLLFLLPSVLFGAWVSPDSFVDEDSDWTNEANAYDGDTTTYCYSAVLTTGHWLEFHLPSAIWCDKIRISCQESGNPVDSATIAVYYDAGWHNIYSGSLLETVWNEKTIPAGTKFVEAARTERDTAVYNRYAINEFEFNETTAPVMQVIIISQ